MSWNRRLRSLLIAAMAVGGATAATGAEVTDPSGRWIGTILFEEGRRELDLVARIGRLPDGGWTAILDLPPMGVEGHAVEHTAVAGNNVELRFDLGDRGGARVMAARLDAGGDRMEGTFTHGLRTSPLLLERQSVAEAQRAVELQVISNGIEGLRERFRGDDGDVRLVLLLAPS